MYLNIAWNKRLEAIKFSIWASFWTAIVLNALSIFFLLKKYPFLAYYREAYKFSFVSHFGEGMGKLEKVGLKILDLVNLDLFLFLFVSTLLLLGWFFYLLSHFWWEHIKLSDERTNQHLRGAERFNARELNKATQNMMSSAERSTAIKIGEISLPISQENRHTLIIGSPGSGKSVLLHDIIKQLITRQEREGEDSRLVIYDRKPEYVQAHFREGQDFLFYPRSKNSLFWDLGLEVLDNDDINFLANSLIPVRPEESQPIFTLAAQDILRCILHHLNDQKALCNKNLIDFLNQYKTASKLKSELKYTSLKHAINIDEYLQDGNAFTSSIMGNANGNISKAIMVEEFYTDKADSRSFCINDYLTNPDHAGANLFVVQPSGVDSWTAYYALFFSFLSRRIRQLNNNTKRRIWTILDEFQTIKTPNQSGINALIDLCAEGRQKGAAVILATQALNSVISLYRKEGMNSLLAVTSNKIFLQNQSPEECELITDIFHEEEVKDFNITQTVGSNEKRPDSQMIRSSIRMTKVVLPAELSTLPIKRTIGGGLEFTALCKIGDLPVGTIHYQTKDHPEKYELTNDEPPREFEIHDGRAHISAAVVTATQSDQPAQSQQSGFDLI
ncbi:hypothetical protein FACS1894103_2010 [Campylobacterota bacterium]|nr:hypothetical protein FACS1894103_2010 [Campylobacterota bacterium]